MLFLFKKKNKIQSCQAGIYTYNLYTSYIYNTVLHPHYIQQFSWIFPFTYTFYVLLYMNEKYNKKNNNKRKYAIRNNNTKNEKTTRKKKDEHKIRKDDKITLLCVFLCKEKIK